MLDPTHWPYEIDESPVTYPEFAEPVKPVDFDEQLAAFGVVFWPYEEGEKE
jgi:hypothetical protein